MHEAAIHIIRSLRRKWIAVTWLSYFLMSVAIALLISFSLYKFFLFSLWWSLPVSIVIFSCFLLFDRSWRVAEQDVARFLNRKYPQLEESTELLLQPVSSLSFLQQLQAQKSGHELNAIQQPVGFYRNLKKPFLFLLSSLLLALIVSTIPYKPYHINTTTNTPVPVATGYMEKMLTAVSDVTIHIRPPAYTGKPAREQQHFGIEAEEGADLYWQIKTSQPAKEMAFIFNDSKKWPLQPVNNEHTLWRTNKTLEGPGFYQLKIDTMVSELYKMEMLKDHPPLINIQSPRANTVIDYGEPQKALLNVTVTDDYGINDVSVAATVSSGNGEAVKFEQKQLRFDVSFAAGLPQYQLKKIMDLTALGMRPGDELYFYVKALDNNRQEKRSDIYIVSIADTAQLMNMEGLMNGINVKPEYFRSERQIIIETEQLIKDKNKLSEEEFKNRGNNLGIDQKLLRLRYGKFLGEEGETNSDHIDEIGNDLKDFSDAEKIRDAYTDKHDNSEDASFFEIATKNQLKATLTEMWNAELRLRTFKPEEALPYEYKALRLLKDLQQKSRAYVAKTSFTTPPLKPEKRLTADLSKIMEPSRQHNVLHPAGNNEVIRNALSVLEQLKAGVVGNQPVTVLQEAGLQLADKAVAAPSVYLSSLEALKRVIAALQHETVARVADIHLAENALQKMIDTPGRMPYTNKKAANMSLSKEYFRNLNQPKPQ